MHLWKKDTNRSAEGEEKAVKEQTKNMLDSEASGAGGTGDTAKENEIVTKMENRGMGRLEVRGSLQEMHDMARYAVIANRGT